MSTDSRRSKKPHRLIPVLSVIAGVALIAFEVYRFRTEGAEKWFWLAVAVFLVAVGTVGVVQKPPAGPPS